MRLKWNPKKERLVQPPHVNIRPPSIGDVESVLSVDTLFNNIHAFPTFRILANRLVEAGYEKNKTLFGIGYDWRFGLWQGNEFWCNVRTFIERIVEETGEKAVLAGHSMGGYFCHYFLSNETTAEWRSRYIDSTIMIAPSLGGCGGTVRAVWRKRLPFLSILGPFEEIVNTFAALLMHMPNAELYANTTLYVHTDGRKFTGAQIWELFDEFELLSADGRAVLQHLSPFFETMPRQLDVPAAFFYNSGMRTVLGIDASNGTDRWIHGPGDRVVNSDGVIHFCKTWKNVTCYDMNTRWPSGDHLVMLWTRRLSDFVLKWVLNGTTVKVPETPRPKDDL
jgi:lecithin-cholesterol acyltransferase